MRRKFLSFVCLTLVVSAVPALGQSDPLSGTWTGDWGPSAYDRNEVTVEFRWNGSSLAGTVNPGPNAVEILNASFDPATGTVRMEAEARSFRGMIHYTIVGTLEGETIAGSWNHDDRDGDFSITKAE